ncbi:hypothetical protein JCM8547_006488 [Rhodosporidiobolus lusitaniae]
MLLSLPPELVEHIVRLLEPITITSKSYQQRQDTLRALCLVSFALKEIAQPVLEEASYWPASWEGPVRKERAEAEYRKLRFLWMHKTAPGRPRNLASLLPSCTQLREVRLSGYQKLDLSSLRRIVLRDIGYFPPQQPVKHLFELTLDSTKPVDATSTAQLESSSFPSLRAFAFLPRPAARADTTFLTHLEPFISIHVPVEGSEGPVRGIGGSDGP